MIRKTHVCVYLGINKMYAVAQPIKYAQKKNEEKEKSKHGILLKRKFVLLYKMKNNQKI
jgi:hypothetical protein